MNYQEFFKDHEDYYVEMYFYGQNRSFTLEQLYQAFKDRMEAERSEANGQD